MWFEDFERKILQHSEAGGKPNRVLGRGKSLGTNLGGEPCMLDKRYITRRFSQCHYCKVIVLR